MSLRTTLYQFCKLNELEDMACIIQLALVNYAASNPSNNKWIYLSPEILDSFIGIGENKIKELLEFLAERSDAIERSYRFFCPEKEYEFCDTKSEEDLEDDEIELVCNACGNVHQIFNKDECQYEIDYEGQREIIINELKLTNSDIANELIVLNVNEDHIEKLASIILSRLQLPKNNEEKAKGAIVKMLHSVKEVSGLIAGISEDAATTVESLRKIAENAMGIATFKDFLP